MTPAVLLLTATGAMTLLMAALFVVQRATKVAGIVDVAWSFGTALSGVWFAAFADGDPARRWIVAAIAALWGIRLGVHLLRRLLAEGEDGRYQAARESWGEKFQVRMFGFFMLQALWAVMFAVPMWFAARNPDPAPGLLDLAGVGVFLVAIAGESLADRQLARHRADPANRGRVCRTGLWRYSRHPNYFFEWLHWFAYVLIGIGGPHGWVTLFGPVVMLVFVTRLTGIPPTEKRALLSRGDAYRDYQRTTSAFIPWPPKAETGGVS